jgi:hypothetical protein
MNAERVDLETLDRLDTVLSRLAEVWDTRISCLERLGLAGLTASAYAVPLVVSAFLVVRTFDQSVYGPLSDYLQSLIPSVVAVAVGFVLLNLRLIGEASKHARLLRRSSTLQLADYLLENRGRPEASASARTLLLIGVPGGLAGLLAVSLASRAWMPSAAVAALPDGRWMLAALAGCVALFFVQNRCHRLLDHLRRRVDLSREVLALRRTLERMRQQVVETERPVFLSRSVALRLSDLDRLYVLGRRAAALAGAERREQPGTLLAWNREALESAERLERSDRFALEDAIAFVSLRAARYWEALVDKRRPLSDALKAGLASRQIDLRRHDDLMLLSVAAIGSAHMALQIDADGQTETLRVLSVHGTAAGTPETGRHGLDEAQPT